MATKNKKKKSIREINEEIRLNVTERLIQAIQNGQRPWRRPWNLDPNVGFPANVKSKRSYNGINVLLLGLASLDSKFDSRWWGTYNNWRELGTTVKKGEKGTKIILVKPFVVSKKNEEDDAEETEENTFRLWMMREYAVFNAEQCERNDKIEKYLPLPTEQQATPDFCRADQVVESTKADVRYKGNRAFYSLQGDYIQMPPKSRYPDERDFHETRFHELIHWTEKRLDWDRKANGYAMGELIAEIGACYLSTELNIPGSDNLDNHSAYLKHWLEGMQQDTKFIFQASHQASKAVDFILSFEKSEKK